MAKIYSQEVLKNLQRLLRSPNKQEVEDSFLATVVNSKTQPIYVKNVHEQFDASPSDYLTIFTAASPVSVGAGAWGTIVTVTAGASQYLYIWGWSVQCDTTVAQAQIALASSAVTAIANANVMDASIQSPSATTNVIAFNRMFTKPISVPAGSSVMIRLYNFDVAARDFNGKIYIEVQKFEERL